MIACHPGMIQGMTIPSFCRGAVPPAPLRQMMPVAYPIVVAHAQHHTCEASCLPPRVDSAGHAHQASQTRRDYFGVQGRKPRPGGGGGGGPPPPAGVRGARSPLHHFPML